MDWVNMIFYTSSLQAADDLWRSRGNDCRRPQDEDEYYRRNGTPSAWPRGLGALGIAAAILIGILIAGRLMDLFGA